MRPSLKFALLAMLCGVGMTRPAAGQSDLRGTVSQDSLHPLANAEVVIEALGLVTRSNAEGVYHLDKIPAGRQSVLVRAVGFRPVRREFEFTDGQTVTWDVRLLREVQQLDSLTVKAPAERKVSAKMRGFEERREAGLGRFLTRADLAAREHSSLADVLRMVPGVRFMRRPVLCSGGFAAANARGAVGIEPQRWMACTGSDYGRPLEASFPAACYFTIYMDGIRTWSPGEHEPPDIDAISVNSLEGVEVYRGPSELPQQFAGGSSSCGAIVMWTRTGEN